MNRFSLDGIRKRSWLTLFNPLNGQQSNEMNVADTSDGEGTTPASEAAGSGGKNSALRLSHAQDELAAFDRESAVLLTHPSTEWTFARGKASS